MYHPGDKILSARELSRQFNVNRMTVLRPIEYVRAFYRADRMRLKVEMTTERPVGGLKTKIDSSLPE